MSYDIFLRAPFSTCPSCGRASDEPELPNPTYNLTPIFDLALTGEPLPDPGVGEAAVVLLKEETSRPRGLRLLNGKRASETIEWLRKALGHLNDPAKRLVFVSLEPPNRWGTPRDAQFVVTRLIEAAVQYPSHTWEVR